MSLAYRLLGKKPEQRPQTAEALIRECATVLESTEDIYRNVLTRAEAVEIGLEMALTPRTRHDTVIASGATQGAPTEGPFQEPTLAISDDATASKGLSPAVVAGFAALIIAIGGVVSISANVPSLPEKFMNFEGLTNQRVGTLPEIPVELSKVWVYLKPSGVTVKGVDEEIPDTSKFHLTRPRGSDSITLTFTKKGYKTYSRSFSFEDPAPAPIDIELTRIEDPRPAVVKSRSKRLTSRPSAQGAQGRKASTSSETAKDATTRQERSTTPAKAKPVKAVIKPQRLPSKPSKLSKLKQTKKLKPTLKLKTPKPSKLKLK